MDPVVASKVHFTRSIEDLDKYIPRDRIPKEHGGDEEFEYRYIEPEAHEDDIMQDTGTRDALMVERMMVGIQLLAATAAWISSTTFSGGKEDPKRVEAAKAQRAAIIEKFQGNYWKLDPYVRARALIDRTGVLGPEGKVNS